ncbi:hypothetical protein GCM10017688_41510 [Streptomyces ramulosus]
MCQLHVIPRPVTGLATAAILLLTGFASIPALAAPAVADQTHDTGHGGIHRPSHSPGHRGAHAGADPHSAPTPSGDATASVTPDGVYVSFGGICVYVGVWLPVGGFPMPGRHFPCTTPTPTPTPPGEPTPGPRPPETTPQPTPTPRAPSQQPAPSPPPPRPAPPGPGPHEPAPAPHSPAAPAASPTPPRNYAAMAHSPHGGHSMVTNTLLITTPAVLAGVALRPRSSSGSSGRRSS